MFLNTGGYGLLSPGTLMTLLSFGQRFANWPQMPSCRKMWRNMQWRRIVRMSILALARLAAVDYRVNSPLIFRLCLVVVGGIFVGVIQCLAPVIAGELSVP